ncbi:hypothetical protein H9P43_000977 [Blastocladiella emersonii ATCC 22665]|nr:hypothetical protein H9P43_000977 [Blastocladiella emersonii ATCC 22665]
MVHAIQAQEVARAGYPVLCDLLVQFTRAFPVDDESGDPLTSVVALALETLQYHLRGPDAEAVRDYIRDSVSLDTLFGFLAADDDEVVRAACLLIETFASPMDATSLLESEEMMRVGLAHPNGAVRALVVRMLKRLAPADWSADLAAAVLAAVQHASVPVYDAYLSLLLDAPLATALLAPAAAHSVLTEKLLKDRVHQFRGLEILARALRLSATLSTTLRAPETLAALFTRVQSNPLDYAVYCETLAAQLAPESPLPGTPAPLVAALDAAEVPAAILKRTRAEQDAEAGTSVLLAYASAAPTGPCTTAILDLAAESVEGAASDQVLALTTLRGLARPPLADAIAAHPRLGGVLADTVRRLGTIATPVRSGVLQLVAALAPHSRAFLAAVWPGEPDADGAAQAWLAAAVAAASHVDDGVKEAGMAGMLALASTEWGRRALLRDDRVAYLLDRDRAASVDVKRAKYAVVERLAQHAAGEGVDPALVRQLTQFVRQGPYYMPRTAGVQIFDESV